MKYAILVAASIFAMGASAPAMAGDGTGDGGYVAIGGVMYDSNDIIGVQGTAGYNFAKYFGVEAVVSTGIVDEDVEGTNVTVGVDSSFGGFGVARMSSDQFSIYAKVGYHSTKFSATTGGFTGDLSIDGIAGGIGGDWFFNEHSGVRLEAVSYDAKDLNVQGVNGMTLVSLSYIHKF